MNKKIIIISSISLILILAGVFYWFQWRPTQIRKNCYNLVIKNPFITPNTAETERRSEFNWIYQNCLNMNGLEK